MLPIAAVVLWAPFELAAPPSKAPTPTVPTEQPAPASADPREPEPEPEPPPDEPPPDEPPPDEPPPDEPSWSPPAGSCAGIVLRQWPDQWDALFDEYGREPAKYCNVAAVQGVLGVREPRPVLTDADRPTAADLQPERPSTQGGSGSSTQVDAAPAGSTLGNAGASLGLAGTGEGAQGVATITVNPFSLAAAAADKRKAYAELSRLADFTVVVPADFQNSGTLSFVGVRARIDIWGPFRGSALVKKTAEKFDALLTEQGRLADRIEALLVEAGEHADVCYDALVRRRGVAQACPGADPYLQAAESARAEYERAVQQYRAKADRGFAGLQLDTDVPIAEPDPAAMEPEVPLRIVAYATAGYRSSRTTGWRPGLQFRGGMDYLALRSDDVEPAFGSVWAASFTLSSPTGKAPIHLSAGLQGRIGGTESTVDIGSSPAITGDFIDLALGVSTPLAGAAAMGIGVHLPLRSEDPDRRPTVAASLDWAYLLQKASDR